MIIGNNMNTTYYKVYKRLDDDSNEYEKVSYFDGTEEYESDDNYEFIGHQEEPYVEDDQWHMAKGYLAEDVKMLVECDYCGKHFTIKQQSRFDRANSFRVTLRNSGHDVTPEDKDLYKDNCKKCQTRKVKDTTMISKGFEHFSYNEESRKNWLDNWNKAFAKSDGSHIKSSRGQRYLADMFKGELNKPINGFFADIVVDDKIIIEYDGGGHNLSVHKGTITQQEFNKLETAREDILISKGYKIVRFISESEYFPEEEITKNIISEAIAELYLSDKTRMVIKIGNKVHDPNYGKLQPIKRILEKSEFGGALL